MSQHAVYDRAPRRARTSRPAAEGQHRSPRPTGGGGKPRSKRPSAAPAAPVRSELDLRLDEALALPDPPERTFAELGLPKPMVLALARRDIHAPFAIQARALPDALAGLDVLGRAATGSGKTLAFGLPMLARLAATGKPARASGGRRPAPPRGLVLVPTRELARQVADNLVAFGHTVDLSVTMVYGGAPIVRQIKACRDGVDVVVATPGRLLDLIERKALSLDNIEITVLDEADHMADMGFMPDVRKILNLTPAGGQRLLFSATLDKAVERLVKEYLNGPVVHAVASSADQIDNMTHLAFTLDEASKVEVSAQIAARPGRTLFFVKTKRGADRLALYLAQRGAPALAIHGNLNQNQRQRALAAFAAGSPRVLVATDVAARGIHVDDVDLVVHYDLPFDEKAYQHRSGRTARAGETGTVVSLLSPSEARAGANMLRRAGIAVVTTAVTPGHAEVLAIGNSGTPIPVVEPVRTPVRGSRPDRPARPARSDRSARSDRPATASGRPRQQRGLRNAG